MVYSGKGAYFPCFSSSESNLLFFFERKSDFPLSPLSSPHRRRRRRECKKKICRWQGNRLLPKREGRDFQLSALSSRASPGVLLLLLLLLLLLFFFFFFSFFLVQFIPRGASASPSSSSCRHTWKEDEFNNTFCIQQFISLLSLCYTVKYFFF